MSKGRKKKNNKCPVCGRGRDSVHYMSERTRALYHMGISLLTDLACGNLETGAAFYERTQAAMTERGPLVVWGAFGSCPEKKTTSYDFTEENYV